MATWNPQANELFLKALQLGLPARAAYLDTACAGDAALRAEVEALLAASEGAGSFLNRPVAELGATGDFAPMPSATGIPRESAGAFIGPYKLLEPIGEGGMGTVWMAQQSAPIKRLVAIKLIKAGMDSKQVLARFDAERQALALMDHPNIAKVFDAGTTSEVRGQKSEFRESGVSDGHLTSDLRPLTSDGRPYFVMELVKGVPITKYCDEHHLTPRQRLELFIPVCQAIQHAHQKGVIHRDIKPSNVMVTLYDGKPVPKVIDFGVAKATGQQLTDATLHTGFGAVVGTMEYMSPEQASFNQLDVDTRSDIYSLGVLLYELLAGSPPFTKRELEKAGMMEMLRVIREQEPSKPSTKLSSSDALPALSAKRGTEPARLTKLMRGELDWIVMKALEKDRNRRYETANGFAADVQRYLADETVQACPPSASYLLKKFVRRNKAPLGTAATLLVVTLFLLSVSLWIVSGQRDAAQQDRDRAQKAESQALVDRDLALQAEREKSEQLWQAQLARVQALRWSGKAGRRFDGLAALTDATPMVRSLYQDNPAQLKEHLRALRNEAVACLALPDLRIARRWPGNPPGTTAVTLDARFQRYARADGQGHVSLREIEGDREIQQLACFTGPVAALSFSPDDGFLAARSSENIRVWDLKSSAAILQVQGKFTGAFDFSPDSRQAVVGHEDGTIVLYDLSTGQEGKRLPRKQRAIRIRYHPDGQRLAVSTDKTGNDNLDILTIATGASLAQFSNVLINLAGPFACSPDGSMLAVGDALGKVSFGWGSWNFPGASHQAEVLDVAFNHRGDMVASVSRDGAICLWDPRINKALHLFVVAGVTRLQFSADDQFLGVGLNGSEIRLYEVAPGRECAQLQKRGMSPTSSVQFSPDGRLLAVGGPGGITLFELATAMERSNLATGMYIKNTDHQHSGTALFHPDGKSILTWGGLGGLERWPIAADPKAPGSLRIGPPVNLGIMPPGSGTAGRMALTPDGRTLAASLDWGGSGVVLDLEGKRDQTSFTRAPGTLDVAISPNAQWVATGAYEGGGARVYDARSGRLLRELPGGDAHVAFSPDCQWLVTGTADDYRFWHTGSWQEGRRILREAGERSKLVRPNQRDIFLDGPEHGVSRKDHGRPAGPLAFSANGKLLAIASSPWQVQLLDPVSGEPLATLEGDGLYLVSALCFSPDGSQLAVASEAGQIQLWDLASIHRQLVAMNLDWGQPVPQSAPEQRAPQALDIQVTSGDPVKIRHQTVALCRKQVADFPTYVNQKALAVNLNQLGNACQEKGQLPEAERAYREAVEIFWVKILESWPDTGESIGMYFYANLGNVLRLTGRYQEAELVLRKGLSSYDAMVIKHPFLNVQSWEMSLSFLNQVLGDVLQATSRFPEAEKAFRQALEHYEKQADSSKALAIRLRLARLFASQGQWEKAAKEYPAALEPPPGEHNPDNRSAPWCEYASVLLLLGDNDRYHRVCQQLLERDARDKQFFSAYMYARIFSLAPNKVGNPLEMIKLAQAQVQMNGAQGWTRHTLAVACYRAGRFVEAVDSCQQSMSNDPGWGGHVVNWLLLAMAHHRLGHMEEAREWLNKATTWIELAGEGKPKPAIDLPVPAWSDRLEIQLLLREAQTLVKTNAEQTANPSNAMSWNNRGLARLNLGQTDKAVTDFTKAIELDRKLWQAWHNRATTFAKLSQWEKAAADGSRAIELKPDLAEAWLNRGLAYEELGETDKAIVDFSNAIKLDPKLTRASSELAWLLASHPDVKARDPRRAIILAMKVHQQLNQQDGDTWNTLGVAHYRAGNWKNTIDALGTSMARRNGGDAFDYFFLAMAHWKLGEKEEACKWQEKAIDWLQKNQATLKKRRSEELGRFRAEAEELLKIEKKLLPK